MADGILSRLLQRVDTPRSDLRTVVLAPPAVVDPEGRVRSARPARWVGMNARRLAEARLRVKVHVENDVLVSAVAEHRIGAAVDHRTVVLVDVGDEVRAGLIIDGAPYRGVDGMAGEVGHVTLDDRGPRCRCGSRGCLDAYLGPDVSSAGHHVARARCALADLIDPAS